MKHRFVMERKIIEELVLEPDYPEHWSERTIFNQARLDASRQRGWEAVVTDRPEFVESSVDFSNILTEQEQTAKTLSVSEVENAIISAIEMTDTEDALGEQSPIWEKVYTALEQLRQKAIK